MDVEANHEAVGALELAPRKRQGVRSAIERLDDIPSTLDRLSRLLGNGPSLAAAAFRSRLAGILDDLALALVLGAEGEGLTPEALAAADTVVQIPMAHGIDSLNVAATAAVAMWALAG